MLEELSHSSFDNNKEIKNTTSYTAVQGIFGLVLEKQAIKYIYFLKLKGALLQCHFYRYFKKPKDISISKKN